MIGSPPYKGGFRGIMGRIIGQILLPPLLPEKYQEEVSSMDDRNEIARVFEEVYAENVRTKDLQGYGEMFTEEALWMAPNVPDRCGIEDIVAGFAESIANQDIDPIFTADEIEVMGDFGYVIGISIATIYPNDGGAIKKAKFRALWLMKKVQGSWKIDRQIWNNKPI